MEKPKDYDLIGALIKLTKEAELGPTVATISFNTKKEKDKFIKDNREGKKVFKW